MAQTLSVVIVSKNCEARIEGTITPWKQIANEIIVVDQNSSDQTATTAENTGAILISNEPLGGNFDLNRKLGMQKAKSDWVLYIDTDERPTQEMISELKEFLASSMADECDGVRIPNYFYFLGKQLKYGIYNPNSAEIRLVKKGKWEYPAEKGYHHSVSVQGKVHKLLNGYRHFNINSLNEWFIKTNQYTEHDANQKHKIEQRSVCGTFFKAYRFFWKHYIFKCGFLDGVHGLLAVFYFMLYHLTLDLKIWEKNYLHKKEEGIDFLKSFGAGKPNR